MANVNITLTQADYEKLVEIGEIFLGENEKFNYDTRPQRRSGTFGPWEDLSFKSPEGFRFVDLDTGTGINPGPGGSLPTTAVPYWYFYYKKVLKKNIEPILRDISTVNSGGANTRRLYAEKRLKGNI
jgi:hypothetical protein